MTRPSVISVVRRSAVTSTLSLLGLALVPSAASAQSQATFVPSLSISSVYDDNLFARTVGSGDQMTQLSPTLTAENVAGEATAFEHIGRVGFTRLVSPRGSVGLMYLGRHFVNGTDVLLDRVPLAPSVLVHETHTSNAILLGSTYAVSPSI